MTREALYKIETLLEEAYPLGDYDWKLRELRDTLNSIEDLYNKKNITQDHYLVAKHNVAAQMGQLANKYRDTVHKNNKTEFDVL
jgi:hypothetical protein